MCIFVSISKEKEEKLVNNTAHKVVDLLINNEYIPAIKMLKEQLKFIGLKDAREVICNLIKVRKPTTWDCRNLNKEIVLILSIEDTKQYLIYEILERVEDFKNNKYIR